MGKLSTMAKLAQQRLVSGFWHTEREKRQQTLTELANQGADTTAAKNFMVAHTKQQIEAATNPVDEALYLRVKAVLAAGSGNPLAVLIDQTAMQDMDESARQRYVFNMSAKLQEFRTRFEKEQQFNCQSMSM